MPPRALTLLPLLLGCNPGGPPDPEEDCGAGCVEVAVESSGPVRCEDPSRRAERRFDVYPLVGSGENESFTPGFLGGGVAVGDLTGDGLPDLVLPGFSGTRFLRGTAAGEWVEDPALGAASTLDRATGATLADFDGDGDLDVLITRALRPDVLLRNDGGRLIDVSSEAGLTTDSLRSSVASWADFDGDGELDLFIGRHGVRDFAAPTTLPGDRSVLYRNEGDGTFSKLSLPPAVMDGYALSGGGFDLDGDGWPELYSVHDLGQTRPNAVLWNERGVLSEGEPVGLELAVNGTGLALGDLNGDGRPDLVIPYGGGIALLESEEGPRWVERSAARGLAPEPTAGQSFGWGAELADLDLDGRLDLVVAYGWVEGAPAAARRQPDALFLQRADGTFSDQAEAWGLADRTAGRGFAVADLNGDGWLDLVKVDLLGPTRLYLSRCGEEAWLRVRLRGPSPNTHGVGAKIRLWTEAGSQVRWVHAGGTNFGGGGALEAHFGLGQAEVIDTLEITWPDGKISRLSDVKSRQRLELVR